MPDRKTTGPLVPPAAGQTSGPMAERAQRCQSLAFGTEDITRAISARYR